MVMKILLVFPPPSPEGIDSGSLMLVEPLTLEYIGAGVKDHHDVKVLDLRVEAGPTLKDTLEAFQPDIIGCTGLTPHVSSAKQVCAEAKKLVPGILTVVGGVHASVMPEDYFEPTIDVVVKGEGVHPFKQICEHHEKQRDFGDIDSIFYKKNGDMVFTRAKTHPPLDSLPSPARELTSQVRGSYFNYVFYKPIPTALFRGSVGCIHRCKFCVVTGMLNHQIYRHSVERIISELATIKEPLVFWVDDELFLDPQRAVLLAREIDKAGIKKMHTIFCRSDTIVRHPECIDEWVKIGLKEVFVGFESHKESDLKKMRKGTTLSKNEEVVRILHENQIQIRGNFIVQPDYTTEDFKEVAAYIRKLDICMPSLSVWTPLPGTELYEEEKKNLITHNYNLFDLYHTVLPTRLPLKQFYNDLALYYGQTISPEKKLAALKQILPEERGKFIDVMSKFAQKLGNGYRYYDKNLW
jgi:radical SAM superfamily enzyme YgiQ (UPF0313 family)